MIRFETCKIVTKEIYLGIQDTFAIIVETGMTYDI